MDEEEEYQIKSVLLYKAKNSAGLVAYIKCYSAQGERSPVINIVNVIIDFYHEF